MLRSGSWEVGEAEEAGVAGVALGMNKYKKPITNNQQPITK